MNKNEQFNEIIGELKEKTANFNAAEYKDFLAVQITLKDLDGVFYIEIKDGVLTIEPFEYNDRQANIIMTGENFKKMMNGKLNSVIAFTTGKLKVEGAISKASELSKIFKR
jgi:putative sterol carrier protein